MLSRTDRGQTTTKIQGHASSFGVTVKEMKPGLSVLVYLEYIFHINSVYDVYMNCIKAAGEQGKENFNTFGRYQVFIKY